MMVGRPAAVVLIVLAVGPPAAVAQAPRSDGVKQLAVAKALYASAAYEDALSQLDLAYTPETMDQVDQYRALCLLALGRLEEAERALAAIIRRTPLYRMSDAEVSPRLVTMFADLRKQLLPQVTREIYARAKYRYDWGDFATAAAEFRRMLAVLADPDLAGAPRDLLDLGQLADGFLRLAEAHPAAKATAAGTTGNGAAGSAESATDGADPSRPARIYSALDTDVKAPIELVRRMPVWTPPPDFFAPEFRGALELVIDEAGNVVSAQPVGPVMPNYDAPLRAAAMEWKYRPAMLRDGTPVRYRLLLGYLLKPLGL